MQESSLSGVGGSPRWLHWWAIVTACATLPLLLLGAEVTSRKVGMVDRDWPTYPWHLLVESWRERGLGFLIEHSHRAAGYTVGFCAIVLAGGLAVTDPRRWMKWLGAAALLGVIVQGLLGGFRVRLNELIGPELALIHGCFGQLVFALLVSLVFLSSRMWTDIVGQTGDRTALTRLSKGSLHLCWLLVLQLVFGAILRHQGSTLGQRLHLLLAFGVVAGVTWIAVTGWSRQAVGQPLSGTVKLLAGLVVFQVLFGVEAWLIRFSGRETVPSEAVLLSRDLIRSAHVVIGSLILATAVTLTLLVHRCLGLTQARARLEGAA